MKINLFKGISILESMLLTVSCVDLNYKQNTRNNDKTELVQICTILEATLMSFENEESKPFAYGDKEFLMKYKCVQVEGRSSAERRLSLFYNQKKVISGSENNFITGEYYTMTERELGNFITSITRGDELINFYITATLDLDDVLIITYHGNYAKYGNDLPTYNLYTGSYS